MSLPTNTTIIKDGILSSSQTKEEKEPALDKRYIDAVIEILEEQIEKEGDRDLLINADLGKANLLSLYDL